MYRRARLKRWLLESAIILLMGLVLLISYVQADPPSCWSACDPTKKHVVSSVTLTCACHCGACITVAETCCGYSYCEQSGCDEDMPCCMVSDTCTFGNCT